MTEYYKPIESGMRQIIYDNALYHFVDSRGNFVFDDFNAATSLFALCLIEFYGVDRNKIFYKKDHRIYDIEHKQVNLARLDYGKDSNVDRLKDLIMSEEFQDYLTDYLDCDEVKLSLNYKGGGVHTLNVEVINLYDEVETTAYSKMFEFSLDKQGFATSLLHRFSEDDVEEIRFHASVLGDKIRDYLNDHLN